MQQCLPNCEETRYTAIPSAAPFRRCDFRNFKTNPLCDLQMTADSNTSFAMNDPPMWGNKVLEEYRKVKWYYAKYRMGRQVGYWVGLTLICYVSPSCTASWPLLPNSNQPKQNQADGGTAKNQSQINPAIRPYAPTCISNLTF